MITALAAIAGFITGFLICAIFSAGKFAETIERIDDEHYDECAEHKAAHDRCADALTRLQAERDEILSIIDGNKTVRTSRILDVIGGGE